MKTEIVTLFGGTGFLGRSVTRALCQRGYRVRIASRVPSRVNRLRVNGHVGQVAGVYCSPHDPATIDAAIHGSTMVINLLGILHENRRDSFDLLHREAPKRIARCCGEHGITSLVHVSALGADPASASRYAASKGQGELALRETMPEVRIIRPSVVFGPDDQFFNRFAQMACLSPFLPVFGGGNSKLQPVYVKDVAAGIVQALTDPATRGNTYEFGGPDIMTLREIMEFILKHIKRQRPVVSLPLPVARVIGGLGEFLPNPPLTRDQVTLLQQDNVVSTEALTLKDLGIVTHSAQEIVPDYLKRFRPNF